MGNKYQLKWIRTVKPLPLLLIFTAFWFGGCASVRRYYTPNSEVSASEVSDFEGIIDIQYVSGMDWESRVALREAQGYALIGTADYIGKDANWTGAMRRLGESLKAEKIDYFKKYAGTGSESGVLPVPVTQTATGTAWGTGGFETVSVSSTQVSLIPFQHDIVRNEYHVLYYKKRTTPLLFGLKFAPVGEDLARRVGTRNIQVITLVVPDGQAWKNNLFRGDVILAVDGKDPTKENVLAFFRDAHGRMIKIWRDGKIVERAMEGK